MIICPKCGYREWYWRPRSLGPKWTGSLYEEIINFDDFQKLYPEIKLPVRVRVKEGYYEYWRTMKKKGGLSNYVVRRPIGELSPKAEKKSRLSDGQEALIHV